MHQVRAPSEAAYPAIIVLFTSIVHDLIFIFDVIHSQNTRDTETATGSSCKEDENRFCGAMDVITYGIDSYAFPISTFSLIFCWA